MKRSNRAWILLPVIIVVIAVASLVMSNYQKELGISEPSKGGPAAVSAALIARGFSLGESDSDYPAYADALLVATVAQRNLPVINSADTRLAHLLVEALDCLSAAREAWQAEIDAAWNPAVQGVPGYWKTLHPALQLPATGSLTAADVRRLSSEQASEVLRQAVNLVG